MTPSKELASQLAEELNRTGSLPQLEACIRASTKRAPLLGGLLGERKVRVALSGVREYEDENPFERHTLFWVYARAPEIGAHVLPSLSTIGLFCRGPAGYQHLTMRIPALEAVLAAEGRAVLSCAPTGLARVVCEVLRNREGAALALVESEQQLRREDPFGGLDGYELNPKAWTLVSDNFTAPTISSVAEDLTALEFCAAHGWMHDKQELHRIRMTIENSPASYRKAGKPVRVATEHQVLTRRLFNKVPMVKY